MLLARLARGHRDADGQGVAHPHRMQESQGLGQIYGTWPGQARAQYGRNQRRSPHAMGNHAVELGRCGEFGIEVLGVDVARHDGKQLDILGAQRTFHGGAVAHGDFIESQVADHLQSIVKQILAGGGANGIGHVSQE